MSQNTNYTMSSRTTGRGLEVKLSGRIDSSNAEAFGKDIVAAREACPEGSFEIDLEDLQYISSAGLRMLLRLQKAEKSKIRLLEVNDTVYNVLDTTGFNRLFDVRKALREVSTEGMDLVAKGTTGAIYRVDEDTILKLYSPGSPLSFAEEEQKKAKTALISGIPTAIPYEIVKSGECYGVLFEMVKADTASSVIMKAPESEVPSWGRKLGDLMKSIHGCQADTGELKSLKDIYISRMEQMDSWMTPSQIDSAVKAISSIPDRTTILHGDFHVRNIMLQGDEFLLIDMIDMGYGHPVFDLSMTYISSRLNPQSSPMVIGLSPERSVTVWDSMIGEYFSNFDEEFIRRKTEEIAVYSCPRILLFPLFVPAQTESWKREWVEKGLGMLPRYAEMAPRADEVLLGK